ncbi:glycoside hydrolase superfamily [Lipomyces starkeyi]
MRRSSLFAAIAVFIVSHSVEAAYPINDLAVTPAMGWVSQRSFFYIHWRHTLMANHWTTGMHSVTENLLLSTAEKIAAMEGNLQHDHENFLTLHSLGFRFGMYSDAGACTCGKYAGSLGHETQDAKTFASWDVDYLKYDNCFNEGLSGTAKITSERYRTILTMEMGSDCANSWRMSGDIYDSFDHPDPRCPCTGDEGYECAFPGFHCSAMNILNKAASFIHTIVPGAWNDLDMLEVGNGGMDDEEYKTHFSMWVTCKSPLLMGNNVTVMDAKSLSILNNSAGEIQMRSGPLSDGDQPVVLLNARNSTRSIVADIFYDSGPEGTAPDVKQNWDIHDLWSNRIDYATAQSVIDGNATSNVRRFYYIPRRRHIKMAWRRMTHFYLESLQHGVAMMRLRKHSSATTRK